MKSALEGEAHIVVAMVGATGGKVILGCRLRGCDSHLSRLLPDPGWTGRLRGGDLKLGFER